MKTPLVRSRGAVAEHATPSLVATRTAVVDAGRLPYACSSLFAAVSAAAALLTVLYPEVLTGVPAANGNLRGTAVVMLVVAVPLLFSAMAWTARGSARGLVVWLGTVGYLGYQAVMLCFATPLNSFFLVYVAALGLAVWSAVTLVRFLDLPAFERRIGPRMPARPLAAVALVIAVLNAAAWLMPIVRAVVGPDPQMLLAGSGLLTNPVYVQDLAIWLPLFAAGAIAGWRRQSWGLLVIGVMLVMTVMESIGIATDQWFGAVADPNSPISSLTMTPVFAAIAVIVAVPTFVYLRNIRTPAL
ncbi:MAG TPA: hypothetical protein VIU87_23875 [Mycobacterium sp.]